MNKIKQTLIKRKDDIDNWFEEKWKRHSPPLYLSCDIRHSGAKIAVVDSNLFPQGFNNLCRSFSKDSILAFKNYFKDYYPNINKVMILAEDHTRNKFYLKNLAHLKELLQAAEIEVKVGMLGAHLLESHTIIEFDSMSLEIYKIERVGDRLVCHDYNPDLILSNNDFSGGIPDAIRNLSQEIIPSPHLGWHKRKKSDHFDHLKKHLDNFCTQFDLDPWQLYADQDIVTNVNFSDRSSLSMLADKVEHLLKKINDKYKTHDIGDIPYVYLKSNHGTYGMGILPVFSGDEVMGLNRKKRMKLISTKVKDGENDFLIQEGIPTIDTYSEYPIEPVMYLIGKKDIGGFFRIHESKNELESLNAPGMSFSCLCLHKLDEPHEELFIDCKQKESVVCLSRLLVKLDALACADEMKAVEKTQ